MFGSIFVRSFRVRIARVSFLLPALTTFVFTASVFAELENFEEADLPKWAMMAHDATDYKELGLSADQLDRLLKNEMVNSANRMLARRDDEAPKRLLKEVYAVLDETQEQRLHQIMFQRWMNRDRITKGLQAFASPVSEDIEEKNKRLVAEVAEREKQTIASLPEDNDERTKKLNEFLAWRWKKQTDWLKAELGAEKVSQLIGEPVPLGYTFITRGDPKTAGMKNVFGEPYGGGLYYGRGHSGAGRSNELHHISVSFDPSTGGNAPHHRMRGRRGTVSDRPVDIPEGLTLPEAVQRMVELEAQFKETADNYAEQISELRYTRPGPGVPIAAMKEAREAAQQLEGELRVKHDLFNIEREKARIIVTKLGGDPDAKQKRFRAATALFRQRGIRCNEQPFISHINATAKQCEALDKIWDQFSTRRQAPQLGSDQESKYHAAIAEVLDKRQKKLLNQQLFRRLWYSKDSKQAIELAKITLNEEQAARVAVLPKLIRETNRIVASKRSRGMGFRYRPHFIHLLDRDDEPFLILEEEFTEALADIVGKQAAMDLLGVAMSYDRDWKRPVVIPDGLTLEKAKSKYKQLVAESKRINDKREKLFEKLMDLDEKSELGFDPLFSAAEPSPKEQRRDALRHREQAKYRRYVEELGGTP